MSRERVLRTYFRVPTQRPGNTGLVLLIAGILLLLVSLSIPTGSGALSGGCATLFALPGVLLVLWGGSRLGRAHARHRRLLRDAAAGPADEEVESWLSKSLDRVKDRALEALGLAEEQLVSDLLTIVAPILWSIEGVASDDLLFRRCRDGGAKFGVYSITVIALTKAHLGSYSCVYNFIRDTMSSEQTCEYLYRDIVSVSTGEVSSTLLLPSGEELSTVQEFRVAVPSGEAIRITVDAPKIRRLTGADALPSTGAEKAVRAIRAMLRRQTA